MCENYLRSIKVLLQQVFYNAISKIISISILKGFYGLVFFQQNLYIQIVYCWNVISIGNGSQGSVNKISPTNFIHFHPKKTQEIRHSHKFTIILNIDNNAVI